MVLVNLVNSNVNRTKTSIYTLDTLELDNITLNVWYKLTNLPGLHIYTQSVSNHLAHSKADDGSANWLLRPPEIKTSGIEGVDW